MVESWSLADVTGILNAGGLIGNATCNGPENCTVENNWAGGVVTGINAGGLFGTMGGLAPENWNTGRMFSISRIQNYGSNGGITESEVPIPSTYWDLERSVTPLSGAGEGKSTAEMLDAATYSGWNFEGPGPPRPQPIIHAWPGKTPQPVRPQSAEMERPMPRSERNATMEI